MLGVSRESLAAVREDLANRSDADLVRLSNELLAIASLLDEEASLRAQLADSGTPEQARRAAITASLTGQVSDATLDVIGDVVGRRWASPRDLADAVGILGADAAFIEAENAGRIDAVEDELFVFGRALAASPQLQMALSDPASTDEVKLAIVGQLLSDSQPETRALIEHAVSAVSGRRLDSQIEELLGEAAVRRHHLFAEVTAAISLSDEQEERLAAVLGRIYGRTVELQSIVDPEVLGGVEVRIDDEVIDGTVARRLEEAQRRLVG